MSDETRGADPIVMGYLDDAFEALRMAASAAINSDNQTVKDTIPDQIWDTQDMVSTVCDELFQIEDDDGTIES